MRLKCQDGEFRTIQEINVLRQKMGMKPFSIKGDQGVAEGSLEEVDRRGFLKGLGAAAVAGAAGYKLGQPTSDNSVYKNPKVIFLLGYLEGCKEYITPGKDVLEINTLINDYLAYTKGDATKLWSGSDQFFHDVGVYNKQHGIGEPGYTQVFPNDQEQKAWIQSQGKEALNQLKVLVQQKESVNQGVAEGELTEASVKHVMGRYQVVHNGKVVGTYNAKYEAQDRANHLNDTAKRMPRGNYSDEAHPIRDDGNEAPDYAAMYESKLVEFAGGMGAGSVATAPGVGKGSNVGSLFGGSYSPKNSPFKKTKAKKESVIKR